MINYNELFEKSKEWAKENNKMLAIRFNTTTFRGNYRLSDILKMNLDTFLSRFDIENVYIQNHPNYVYERLFL